jgi:hypothetical protein
MAAIRWDRPGLAQLDRAPPEGGSRGFKSRIRFPCNRDGIAAYPTRSKHAYHSPPVESGGPMTQHTPSPPGCFGFIAIPLVTLWRAVRALLPRRSPGHSADR